MQHFDVVTRSRGQFVDITEQVRHTVAASKRGEGRITVFVPHTTCGLALNDKADPAVAADILRQLDEAIPWRQPFYRHAEGNSAAHLKASLAGASIELFIAGGQIQLGAQQAVFLCEFDGPRTRRVWVK